MKTYTFTSSIIMPSCFAKTVLIQAANIEAAVDALIKKNGGMYVASYNVTAA